MYKFMSYELKDKMDDAANVFFKEPTLPDEVLQYREPVDPKELLAGLTLEKLNAIYKSIIRRQEDKSILSEANSEPSRRKRSVCLIR